MVLITVIKELVKLGAKYGSRYYRLEGKAFNKLYTGFPRSRVIGRGVRHGLTGGSIVGSLISDSADTPGNGIPKTFTWQQPQAHKPYKARIRRSKRFSCRNNFRRYSNSKY